MKKIITALLILVMLISLSCPVAASDNFVSSITYKAAPTVTTTVEEDGTEIVGTVTDSAGETVTKAPVGTIIITPVSEVETSQAIPEAAAQQLQSCYEELTSEEADLTVIIPDLEALLQEYLAQQAAAETTAPTEEDSAKPTDEDSTEPSDEDSTVPTDEDSTKPSEDDESTIPEETTAPSGNTTLTAQDLVVRDLFDVTISDQELEQMISEEGNTIDLTFDIGIEEGAFVAVLVFKNDQWSPVEKVVNNGDGTITCTFSHFCPVAVLTAPHPKEEPPVETAPPAETEPSTTEEADVDTTNETGPWVAIGSTALAAIIVLVVILKRRNGKVKTSN